MKKFDWRGFISIFLLIDFVIIALSGIALFIAPSGRIAKEINFTFLGFDKTAWESIHDIFGFAMIIVLPFHLFFNWKIFVNYFRKFVQKTKKMRLRGTIAAILLSCFLLIASIMTIFPANIISDISEKIKDFWTEKAAQQGYTIEHEDKQQTINSNIQENNNNTAVKEQTREEENKSESGDEEHETGKSGGYGWKTVKQVAEDKGIDPQTAIKNLEKSGIVADEDTTIRTLMDRTGKTARDLIEIMKGETE